MERHRRHGRYEQFDKHHIVHTEAHWAASTLGKAIRNDPSLIAKTRRENHEELHRAVPAVPLINYYTMQRTLKYYEPQDNPLESAEALMTAIEQAANHPKAHIIEKHLAELAVWAIDLQRPFLTEDSRFLRFD